MMRVDASQYANQAALHALGALTVADVQDENGKVIAFDLAPDVDLDGYEAAVAKLATAAPNSVTSAQAKIQLRRAGIRDKVDAAIKAADGEVQDWFTDARVWERNNPHVIDIGTSIGLKSADLDALFESAAQISV